MPTDDKAPTVTLQAEVEAAEKELAAGKGVAHEQVADRILKLAQRLDRDR